MSPPPSLVAHILFKIKTLLSKWKSTTGWSSTQVDVTAQVFVDKLYSDAATANNNKAFMETGIKLSRALEALEDTVASGSETLASMSIADILQRYDDYLNVNHTVFENITAHHNNIVSEKWSDVAANDSSLAVYSEAANAMGSKVWVAECNKWFETFSIAYFRKGGARKHYLRSARNAEEHRSAGTISSEEGLAKDLMAVPGSESSQPLCTREGDAASAVTAAAARKIRVLDVGSCYNPIARSEQAALFDVTALDLYPVDASVLQCDFLNLVIGPAGSEPVVAAHDSVSPFCGTQEAGPNGTEQSSGEHPAKKQKHSVDATASADAGRIPTTVPLPPSTASPSPRLWRLPAAAYDVVTMSLVLSYLPLPAQRLQMVRQARALLMSPAVCTSARNSTDGGTLVPHSDTAAHRQPHRNCLLLIAEKQSIFKPPFKLGKHHDNASQKRGEKDPTLDGDAGAVSQEHTMENRDVNYWQAWVDAICACGFELVKYHYFPSSDGRKSHLFAFGTVPLPATTKAGTGVQGEKKAEMWIKQDHERATSTGGTGPASD
jgi:hypothetical protein